MQKNKLDLSEISPFEKDMINRVVSKMEDIIGNECYMIKNKESLLPTLVNYKFPFHYMDKEKQKMRTRYITESMTMDEINSCYYSFGANQLFIGKAILNIIHYLKENYNIDIIELEKKLLYPNEIIRQEMEKLINMLDTNEITITEFELARDKLFKRI